MKNLLIALSLVSNIALANVYSPQYSQIKSVEMVEVLEVEGVEVEKTLHSQKMPTILEELGAEAQRVSNTKNISKVIMVTKDLIALGKEVYSFIEENKPVVTLNTNEPLSVLPKANGISDGFDLTNWKRPYARKFRVKYKNYLGMTPVNFEFMLFFNHGGKYMGKGAYLTGAQIKGTDISVGWGYNLKATTTVNSIMNEGTVENPIAGAVLDIQYTVSTIVKSHTTSKKFYINGLGAVSAY